MCMYNVLCPRAYENPLGFKWRKCYYLKSELKALTGHSHSHALHFFFLFFLHSTAVPQSCMCHSEGLMGTLKRYNRRDYSSMVSVLVCVYFHKCLIPTWEARLLFSLCSLFHHSCVRVCSSPLPPCQCVSQQIRVEWRRPKWSHEKKLP